MALLRQATNRLDPNLLEVKTISERSHEDTGSMASSVMNTPAGNQHHSKNYLSGGTFGHQLSMQDITSSHGGSGLISDAMMAPPGVTEY